MDITFVLPEECLSQIIYLTSTRDACRFSVVFPIFKSAADSDAVWEKFPPSDCKEIISDSATSSLLSTCLSEKDLYFHFCRNKPILINNGIMTKRVEKCYMVGARSGISITWGGTSGYWIWPSPPESRFPEVAELKLVCWLEVRGRIETKILSSETTYAACLAFKFAHSRNGLTRTESFVSMSKEEDEQEVWCCNILRPICLT